MSAVPGTPEDRVRDLLRATGAQAGAGPGATEPAMPPEVARLLEDRLAALQAERGNGPVAALRPGRRRRVAGAAAAAVVVVGLGAGGVAALTRGTGSSDSSGSSSSSAVAPPTAAPTGTTGTTGPEPSASARTGGSSPPDGSSVGGVALPAVRSESFARDVRDLLRGADRTGARLAPPGAAATARSPGATSVVPPALPSAPPSGCTRPRTVPGARTVAVALDGRPAVLVLGPVTRGSRTVTAFACGERAPVRTARVTVPAR